MHASSTYTQKPPPSCGSFPNCGSAPRPRSGDGVRCRRPSARRSASGCESTGRPAGRRKPRHRQAERREHVNVVAKRRRRGARPPRNQPERQRGLQPRLQQRSARPTGPASNVSAPGQPARLDRGAVARLAQNQRGDRGAAGPARRIPRPLARRVDVRQSRRDHRPARLVLQVGDGNFPLACSCLLPSLGHRILLPCVAPSRWRRASYHGAPLALILPA